MRIIEKSFVVLMIAAVVMRLLMMPISGVLMVLSALGLACLYFLLGAILFNKIRLRDIIKKGAFKDVNTKEMILGGFLGFSLSIVLVGILFKWMEWPFAGNQLLIGVLSTVAITVVILIMAVKSFRYTVLSRAIPLLILGVVFYSFSTFQVSKWVMRDHPEIVKAYEKIEKDPDNVEFQIELRELELQLREEQLKLRFDEDQVDGMMQEERSRMKKEFENR